VSLPMLRRVPPVALFVLGASLLSHRTMVVAALATITWLSRLFCALLSIIVLTGVLSADAPQRTTDRGGEPGALRPTWL